MEIKYFDIHSHLGFEDLSAQAGFGTDQKEVIQKMHELGVATITIGTGLESSKEVVRLASEDENIWACIGNHPDDNSNETFDENDYEELVKNPKVVAIGECGLDYFRFEGKFNKGLSLRRSEATGKGESLVEFFGSEKTKQKEEFIKQIEFAVKYNKVLMLHVRDNKEAKGEAYNDAYNILKKYEGKVRGNMHFFAGDLEWAKKFIELGYTISFTGVITFAKQYDEVIKSIPLEFIHAETDAPFVAPVPHRGERNEPVFVIDVVKKIAEIRGEDFEKVRIQLLENAKRVFGL